ncbi:MAG: CinA family nicotinamide mononucleotide deamidase-related protein [Chloroflexota bacterium]|nr:CinA family nicotinamide mononucleotide deamidase-related protein [Chloroflexota bacterium]
MDAEIITTGTEILLGEIVDTNATWIARRLRDLGLNLYFKTTVGDNQDRIAGAMRQSLDRSDLLIVTGGLGPTVDDVTREAAASAAGRALVLNRDSLKWIETIFGRWGRTVENNNRRQAFMPEGATPIHNPVGTAPGFILEVPRDECNPAYLICLPGVPREMKHLMRESVEPFIAQLLGPDRLVIKARILRTVGIGESTIDERIGDLMHRSNPTVGLAAHLGQADIRIVARAASEEEAEALIEEVVNAIQARLGRFIFGEGDVTLEQVVIRGIDAAGHSLTIVETNTGDEIARRIAEALPDTTCLRGSHQFSAPEEILPGLETFASQEAAERLAQLVMADPALRQGASLVMVVSGDMDPAAGPYGAYRGQTFLALANGESVDLKRLDVGGTGEIARRWIGNGALNWLRMWLAQQSDL